MTTVSDDFNRANSTTNLGSTSVGSVAWTKHTGTWGISSNRAYVSAGVSSTICRATVAVASGDGTVSGTVITTAGPATGGLIIRSDGSGNEYMVEVTVGAAAVPAIYKGTAGSFSSIATGASTTVASGSVISVVLSGGSITVQDDGVTIVTVTDTSYNANTGHGMYIVAPASTTSTFRVDNFSATIGTPVDVTAPAFALAVDMLNPTVTAGTGRTVAAPALALAVDMLNPTVVAGSAVTVAAPVLSLAVDVLNPTVVMGATVNVSAPVLSLAVNALDPTVTAGTAVSVAAPVLSIGADLLDPTVTTSSGWMPGDTLYLSAPSPRHAALTTLELYTPAPDVLLLAAPSLRRASLRVAPTATPVPAGITERPIMRQAHLMPPKSQAEPVRMGDPLRARAEGSDGYLYPVEETPVGRFRVFASGIDVTYWTGAPTTVHEWSFAKPLSCKAASFTVPLREWEVPGVGPLSVLWADASIEIAVEDDEGNLRHLWDGFTAEEEDVSAPGQTGVTWHCEGTLMQAAHWPWDAPIIMEERDIGHVIADAMNSVPNHRYTKFKRFTTGKTTTTRGDSSQSVLSNVLKWIEEAYSDDGEQLAFRRVGPFAYVIDWAIPAVTPHYTYTKGSPGFNASLTRPHSSRRDAVFGRGVAPDGGFWMNRVFPGLLASMPPAYPMANPSDNMSVGTTDADTVTGLGVTTWQRQMRVAGYPVVVDGVVNSADTKWILKVQQDRGLLANGVLGPQTWAATWEGGPQTPETLTYRLPIAVKDSARPYDYDASGKILRDNPLFDRGAIVYATPEVDAGTNIKKTTFIPLAAKILTREGTPGYVGSLTATGVDPWEEGESRLFITDGQNVEVLGHHGGIVVQTAEVTQTPQSTRLTVDSRARGQAVVDAVMARERDVRRDLAARATRTTDRGALNASQLGQYESESPAGKYSRTAINGDVGLWTVRCIYVAEQGLARFQLSSSPKAEFITAVFGRHVTPNQVASLNPDPLADAQPWRTNEAAGRALGLIEVCGTPDSPGGYFPYTKSGDSAGPLTGDDMVGNLSMKSQRGGFFWIAVFTSRSAFVEGEFEPEVYET